MGSFTFRRKLKYSDMVEAAFGRERLSRGDAAKHCNIFATPRSHCRKLIESSLAGPESRVIDFAAAYCRWSALVPLTNQETSMQYLRHVLELPSHDGI